ncbi:MAG: PTS sugar transporter subunit IIA [Spirochaetia bacterium]|nr:PTS sugar transporter subunit IIA [Spirochaetia bacterium]
MENKDNLMTLAEVAEYLKLSDKTILKMVKAREIPCAKISNQWRFLRSLIDDWLIAKMEVIPKNDLSRLIEQQADQVPLSRLITAAGIITIPDQATRDTALLCLTDTASELSIISDSLTVHRKILEREEMISTGIGNGFAIPHMRTPSSLVTGGPRIIIGIASKGIEYNSLDGLAVRMLFLILSDSEIVHLRIIAKLTQMLSRKKTAASLLKSETPQEVYRIIAEYDRSLLLNTMED